MRLAGAPRAPLSALLLGAALMACGSPQGARRDYLRAHPDLDAETRERIAQGRVQEGMSLEQVRAALGPPDSRRAFEQGGEALEVWTYPGALVLRRITRTLTDLDYRVRLIFRAGVLERIEEM